MATIRIPEAEAARNFAALMARVRAGAEVIIDDASPAVVWRAADERTLRRLSESLSLAKERGSEGTLDGGFAQDLEAEIERHPDLPNRQVPARRTIEKCIALLPEDSPATIDEDFASDVAAAAAAHRESLNPQAWD